MEEFYTNYLKEMEKMIEIKSDKAEIISKQHKEERITRIIS